MIDERHTTHAFRWRSVRADRTERVRRLPGDRLIATPAGSLTHAVTINDARERVWPWLIQMGAGSRAGWYSYDFLDNGRRPSASQIVAPLQEIAIGTVFPALPGLTEGFVVLDFEPFRSLILGWPGPAGRSAVTWAFVLEDRPGGATRLIVRARASEGYRFRGLPPWCSVLVARVVHFIMQRKQLLGIARRVEATRGAAPPPAQ